MLRAVRGWALGRYEPAAPETARRTEAEVVDVGRTPITLPDAIPAERRRVIEDLQIRQHDIMNRVQEAVSARELEARHRAAERYVL